MLFIAPLVTYRRDEMKVLLLNDTSLSPHVGSLAVSAALDRLILESGGEIAHRVYVTQGKELWRGSEAASLAAVEQSPLSQILTLVDGVVLNGEGTLHHDNGLHYLAILGLAQRRGLKTFLVNSIFQEMSFFHEVVARLDRCICREPLSLAAAQRIHPAAAMRPDLIVDAEPEWESDYSIDLEGKIIFTDWHPQRTKDVGTALLDFGRRQPQSFFYPLKHGVHSAIWRSARANFARADAVVSARHHGVYLAVLTGRPCVMLESNSHKMAGLQQLLGAPLQLCQNLRELESALQKARAAASGFQELQARLLAFPRPDFFDSLGEKLLHPAQAAERLPAVREYQTQPRHWLLQTPEKSSLERAGFTQSFDTPR